MADLVDRLRLFYREGVEAPPGWALLAEAADEIEALRAALGRDDPHHYATFSERGFATEHPVVCRHQGQLTECPIHHAVAYDCTEGPPRPPGRYLVWLDDDGRPIYERDVGPPADGKEEAHG